MKVPISWLKDHVNITLPMEELAERLTLAGLEVSGIEYFGIEGADLPWDGDKIVVGHILVNQRILNLNIPFDLVLPGNDRVRV